MKLYVKATPNAKRSEITGWQHDPLRGPILLIKIAAPATEGKANAELLSFLSQHFGIAKSHIKLEKGDHSRIKCLSLPDDTQLPTHPKP